MFRSVAPVQGVSHPPFAMALLSLQMKDNVFETFTETGFCSLFFAAKPVENIQNSHTRHMCLIKSVPRGSLVALPSKNRRLNTTKNQKDFLKHLLYQVLAIVT